MTAREAAGPTSRPLVLEPFRGLRFDPTTAGDLGTLVSPPYDVLDAPLVKHLEEANRHNVVRLILSRHFEPPYQAVRRRLEKWRTQGYLAADSEPALYLYEYTVDGVTVAGLIGLLALRDEEERVVLPHEDVMAPFVADRALLMRTTQTNLEPILLVHPGSPDLAAVYDAVRDRADLAHFTAVDGSRHRLWRVVGSGDLAAIAAAIAPQQALIADGHHRYAAYLRLQGELADGDDSPWNRGLALLVPDAGETLVVGPIHRVVHGVSLAEIVARSAERGDTIERELPAAARQEVETALAASEPDPRAHLWLFDGARWLLLRTRRTGAVDAAVLHEDLLPSWGVDEEQVSYHHSVDQAVAAVARGRDPASGSSVAVLLHAPALAEVTAAAARGVRLPRKSTSFAPKPRMGVVMRDLRDR